MKNGSGISLVTTRGEYISHRPTSYMLTVISDTHGTDSHRLTGRTREAVQDASHVIHAGDFTTEAVLDSVAAQADNLTAVAGNRDNPAVRERLPDVTTLEWERLTFAIAHGHQHTETALELLARQEHADIVVIGHSHRPEITELDSCLLINPGSYADPRRHQPGHAELDTDHGSVRIRLRSPHGETIETRTQKLPW
jgi:putative phosphoesterase